jgi:hypothetical protein
MLQFQPVYPGSICVFNIEIIKIVIDPVDNPYTKRLCISIDAKVDSVYIKVLHHRHVSLGLQQRIDFFDGIVDFFPVGFVEKNAFPKSVVTLEIVKRYGIGIPKQILVMYGEINFPSIMDQIFPERGTDGVDDFLFADQRHIQVG